MTVMFTVAVFAQDVKVEFITPSIVHIVKGQPTKTLVVTAKPEDVAVSKSGSTWKAVGTTSDTSFVDKNAVYGVLNTYTVKCVNVSSTGEVTAASSFVLPKSTP